MGATLPSSPFRPTLDAMKKHILVTSDISPEAARAYKPVADLARLIDAEVTVLHVLFIAANTGHAIAMGTPVGFTHIEGERVTVTRALEEHVMGHFDGLDVTLCVEAGPDVARAISNYADEHDVDLIAISTHGRSGLKRLVLGSVAERVLRYAHTPVLCFPPEKKTVVAGDASDASSKQSQGA